MIDGCGYDPWQIYMFRVANPVDRMNSCAVRVQLGWNLWNQWK
jgi:hypothetical protein